MNHAYVTTIGRLICLVSLKELRKAIEDANSRGQSPGTKQSQAGRYQSELGRSWRSS